jgi:hypothetical protein
MWNNIIQISKVASSNCGGVGAWIDNPLSSPNPSGSLWRGFQLGGGGKRKMIKMRKMRKTRQVRKRRMSRKTRRKTKTSS